jgi:glycosyltransferase involved in cell wall biosynthesis
LPSGPRPLISVIVPTRDRAAALGRCLEALSAQTALDRLEVVVVDDGSIAASEVVAAVVRDPHARLVLAGGHGPAAARNEGARNARGTVLCFTDDDCVPEREWAERLADAIERGADAVAGTTVSAGGALADAAEIVAQAPARARDVPFAPSNNFACTKAAFEATPFDESYPHAAGEDRDWCARLAAGGYVLRAESGARLVHRPALTLPTFLRKQVHYGEGAYRFRRRNGARTRLEPLGFYVALLRRSFACSFTVGLLVLLAQAATALGFVRGWAVLRRVAAEEMTHESDRNGRHRDQAVREEKGYARGDQPAAAAAEEQGVERPVEHEQEREDARHEAEVPARERGE